MILSGDGDLKWNSVIFVIDCEETVNSVVRYAEDLPFCRHPKRKYLDFFGNGDCDKHWRYDCTKHENIWAPSSQKILLHKHYKGRSVRCHSQQMKNALFQRGRTSRGEEASSGSGFHLPEG